MRYIASTFVLAIVLSMAFAQETQTETNASEDDVLIQIVLGAKDVTAEDMRLAYKVIAKRLQFLDVGDIYLGKFDKKKIVLYGEPAASEAFYEKLPDFTSIGGLDFSLVKTESKDLPRDSLTVADLQEAAFDENDIAEVSVGLSSYNGEPELLLSIEASSQDKFEEFTKANLQELLVISTGETILISPIIQGALREGAMITGNGVFDGMVDAERLALSIYSGRLPVALEVFETSIIDRAKAKY